MITLIKNFLYKFFVCNNLIKVSQNKQDGFPFHGEQKMKKIFKIIACAILCNVILFCTLFIYAAYITADATFDASKLTQNSETTVFFDCNGSKIGQTETQTPVYVPIQELPSHVKNAFVAIEDKRFYSHRGIDFKRILSAAKNDIISGNFDEGASTISQQLIKNTHLSPEKTITRKLKEIKLTLILEKNYTKDEILEMYLNTIYFGEGAYGIQNASVKFFGKDASALEPHESALLAAVIKAPAYYSPYSHPENALKRRNVVLKCMIEQGYVPPSNREAYTNKPLELSPQCETGETSQYVMQAKKEADQIISSLPLGFYEKFNVYTYLNPEINRAVYEEMSTQDLPCDYSSVLTDNSTHGVCAFVSSVEPAKRCPASTVKPWLVYAPAIDTKEITIATKILDEKTDFNGFKPNNHNGVYNGYISAKEALYKSLNVPAVKIANGIGIPVLTSYAEKMNLHLNGGLGMALGGIDEGMTLKEICDRYSVFTSGGNFEESKFIYKITTKDGKTVYQHSPEKTKVFDEGTVYVINDALSACAQMGTAKKLKSCNLPLCAKTGTNGREKGNMDAYCISYSPEFTLGTWLGRYDNSLMPNSISGGTYPTIMAGEIWQVLSNHKKITAFQPPEGIAEIRLDKKDYEDNYRLTKGTDGPTFWFLNGTEPKEAEIKKKENAILNIHQDCTDGTYALSFDVEGYDGVEIYVAENKKREELIREFLNCDECTLSYALKANTDYRFSILPFKFNVDEREYFDRIDLSSVKYIPKQPVKPPAKFKWWEE